MNIILFVFYVERFLLSVGTRSGAEFSTTMIFVMFYVCVGLRVEVSIVDNHDVTSVPAASDKNTHGTLYLGLSTASEE